MAYEIIDLKGLLFVVLLSIPLTSSANIDCGGKPFHCLNSSHFMICVDLGGGLSTTIDDFVIPCPPPTMCHKDNKFECEFPKIEETTTPLYTISIPGEKKKSVLPQTMDNLITIQPPPVETTIVSTVTEQNTATQLPMLEETSPFINEVLENLKEEFATGNEKFFEGDTTKQSTTTVSSSYSTDEIKGPKIYDLTYTTENYNNLKLKSEPLTAYAVETTEIVIPKLIDSNPSADVIPTVSTNIPKDNSSIQIGLHLTNDTFISDLFKFNQTKQNNTNEPNSTLDVLAKNLEMPTSLLHFSVDESPMIDKQSAFNRTNYVASLQNTSTPATLIESVIENTINALNHSEIAFETITNYNDRNNFEFHIEPKDNNSIIDEYINQNISKVIHYSQEFSTEIPEKASQHENMTSNQNIFSVIEITTTKLPTIIFKDNGINNLSAANTKVSSDIFLNQNAFNNTPLKDSNDISTKANAEINMTDNFNDDTSNIIINMTHVDLSNKLPELAIKEEAIANDIAHLIDKPSITEYTTTLDFVPSTNFKQSQTSKLGTTTFQTTISDNKQTSVTDSLTTRIDDQVILPENNFTSTPLIENSIRSSALEDALTYFSSITEESVKMTPLHYTYEETTILPVENTTKNITIEVVESTLSLPASNKDAIQNITPAPKFTVTTGYTNGNDLIITGRKNNGTKTESEKMIGSTMIDSNSNNTLLIASNYWQNLNKLDLDNNTTVNRSHIVSELSKLITTEGSNNANNIVTNDTFINYIEDLNASKSNYGTIKNINMKTDAGTTQHVGNVPQLQNSINVPIFAVQNDSMNLKPFTNVNINNNLDEQNKTFFMKAVQDKKTYQSEQVVHSSTIVNVIKPQRPEYVTESILLSELSTEASLPTATAAGPKIINYVKRNMLLGNSKPDIISTKTSKKPTYTNIPNNIVVSPMRTNMESPNLAYGPIFHQVTPLPPKSATSNKLGISKTKAVSNVNTGNMKNTNKNNKTSSSFKCSNITSGKYADSRNCRKFYTCWGKLQPILGICPNNTVFSEITKLCTRNLSHCVRNNQFHCVYEGRFSDLLKDNTFYICVKNKSRTFVRYTLRCKNGYHLNKSTVKCEHSTEKNESANSSSNSNISNDTNGSSVNSDTSEKSDFECKDDGNFPFLKDCRKYYECTKNSKGEYRRKIKTCASEEMYDSKKKKCVPSESEEC